MTKIKTRKIRVLLFLGPATVGKGTQADFMSAMVRDHCVISGSSTEIVEHSRRTNGASEEEVKASMKVGHLVPDDAFVNAAFFYSLDNCKKSRFIGDGWGRTLEQVKLLVDGLKEREISATWVIFEASDETLENHRLERVRNGSVRPDDDEVTHKERIAIHRERIGPIERYLVANGENVVAIATDNLPINRVFRSILTAVPSW